MGESPGTANRGKAHQRWTEKNRRWTNQKKDFFLVGASAEIRVMTRCARVGGLGKPVGKEKGGGGKNARGEETRAKKKFFFKLSFSLSVTGAPETLLTLQKPLTELH